MKQLQSKSQSNFLPSNQPQAHIIDEKQSLNNDSTGLSVPYDDSLSKGNLLGTTNTTLNIVTQYNNHSA